MPDTRRSLIALLVVAWLIAGCGRGLASLATLTPQAPTAARQTSPAPTASPLPPTSTLVPSITPAPSVTATTRPSRTPPVPTATATPIQPSGPSPTPHPLALSVQNAPQVQALARVGYGRAHDVAWSADGALLAVAADFRVDLYSTKTWNRISGIETEARHVAFSPTEGVIAVAGERYMRTFFAITGRLQHELISHIDSIRDLAYSPGGRWLAALGSDCGGCGDPNFVVEVWDTKTGASLWTVSDYGAYSARIAFSPDGRTLAVSNEFGLRLLDADTGLSLPNIASRPQAIAFLPNGQLLGHMVDGGVGIIAPTNGATIRPLAMSPAEHFVMSPDARTVALTGLWENGTHYLDVQLWDVTNDQPLARLSTATEGARLAFSPDGQYLAAATYTDAVEIWDTATGQPSHHLTYSATIRDVLIGPASSVNPAWPEWIGLGDARGQLQLWDPAFGLPAGLIASQLGYAETYDFSSDGKLMAMGSSSGLIQLTDLTTGQSLAGLSCDSSSVYKLLFSADGRRLAANCQRVIIWEVASQQVVRRSSQGGVVALDGDQRLVTIERHDAGWTVIDVESAQPLRQLSLPPEVYIDEIRAWAFSADGLYVAAGSSFGELIIWEADDPQPVQVLSAHHSIGGEGQVGGLEALAFGPSGHLLATVGSDGAATLWNPATGQALNRLKQRGSALSSVTFSPDGRWLAAGGWDGTATIWGLP